MHYNPLKYVKTDTDILSFVNCFIMNTNPEGKSSGDPFWENAEKMLYTALIALLRDWFPAKDYNMSSLLTLLSLAERYRDERWRFHRITCGWEQHAREPGKREEAA